MWQSQEEISRMTKPCRNNSPSYEACYGHWEGCAVWGRVQRAAESLLQDLQRKERDCPFLQVLKTIQGRSLNKGVSSTANRAFLFLASEEEGNLGRDNLSRPISSPLCDCKAWPLQREPSCPHTAELKLFQALTRNIEVKILDLEIGSSSLLKNSELACLNPSPTT